MLTEIMSRKGKTEYLVNHTFRFSLTKKPNIKKQGAINDEGATAGGATIVSRRRQTMVEGWANSELMAKSEADGERHPTGQERGQR
jgi:hypothetical protein